MLGKLYIDGRDAYREWGVFVTQGAYKELACFPPAKAVESADWSDQDGVEVDLSDPKLNSKEVSITFAVHGKMLVGAFFDLISDGAYHTFDFREIGRTYKLRLVSEASLDVRQGLRTFSLSFADDFPLQGYTYLAPRSELVPVQGFEIDGVDLAQYGVWVLKGSEQEILKAPAVKENLLQNIGSMDGAIYDGGVVYFKSKQVKLSCLMRASSIEEFWRNYDALLFDLVRPEERSLYVDWTGYEYPCYYKSCSVQEFLPTGRVWFRFDLELVFTSFRVEGDEYLLASEVGEWIMAQDGEFAIDLNKLD